MNMDSPLQPLDPDDASAMDRMVSHPSFRRRYWLYAAAGGVAIGVAAWLLAGAGGRVYRVPEDRVTIGTVTRGAFEDFAAVRGTVAPYTTNYLTTDQGGAVKQVLVEDGTVVKAGQPILILANPVLQMQVAAREAETAREVSEVQNTQLQLEQTRLTYQQQLLEIQYQVETLTSDLERDKRLLQAQALAQATYEKDKARLSYEEKVRAAAVSSHAVMEKVRKEQLSQLKNTIGRLNANLDAAHQSLDALTIRASMDGQLTALNAEVGQSKAAGAVLGQIDSLDRFKLTAEVDEFYLGRVKVGQQAIPLINGRESKAKVGKLYPQISNGTFKIDLAFDGQVPAGIHNGQAVDLKLELGGTSKALMLPNGAFYQDTGGNWVFVLKENGHTATRRNVRLGRRNPESVEVLEGLVPGERVIVSSYAAYQNIDRVEIESK